MEKMNKKCNNCNANILENDNFCASCGKPLNEVANNLEIQKGINAKLEVLIELSGEVQDLKTLMILKKHIEELSKK